MARQDYVEFCRDADVLFHDAEYNNEEYSKRQGWGHSTIEQAVDLALDAGVGRLGLFHHNQDHLDDEIDAMVLRCRQIIRERNSKLDCFAVYQMMELTL